MLNSCPHKHLIVNQQDNYVVNIPRLREYLGKLKRALRLGKRDCNVCLVDDKEIRRLNAFYLGRDRATDVLSFPWIGQQKHATPRPRNGRAQARRKCQRSREFAAPEFRNFLGDIVISVGTARRNARRDGHSTLHEIRWLVLHGLLHLLGYDHERDRGEMARRELALRRRMGISGD